MTEREANKIINNMPKPKPWEVEAFYTAIKALEQTELEPSYNSIKTELDCISRTDALDAFKPKGISEELWMESNTYKVLTKLPSVTPKLEWIPVKTREMTPEEIEELGLDNDITTMFDCELPDDGEEVLVTTPWGVKTTTFYEDYGCYFEYYEDDGDVLAWMRLPKGYEPEQAQPHMMCEED